VPRNRSASSAVLSSFQRAASYSPRARTAVRRRVVVGALLLLSLGLITAYFRESPNGTLHGAQSAAATVLSPFQVAVERVARPFRDLYGYFDGLVGAKSENARLQEEVQSLRQQVIANETAVQENEALRSQLALRDLPTLKDYTRVNARVIGHPIGRFEEEIVISAGSSDGIRMHSPVRTRQGLVGEVTLVTSQASRVTLLIDQQSAVSALDLKTRVTGLVRHGQGDALLLDRVPKDRVVGKGDQIVTAGSQVGELPSLYPKGIPIGEVTFVGQSDTEPFKQIQVDPFVDFSDLYAVTVLVSRKPMPELP
jgi:rod shape-determining protein MreC